MDDSPSAHRWLTPLVCDTAPLIDRRLRARDWVCACYLLSRTDVHAQHNLGERALVDHFAHQVAAHTLSVRKVLEQVTGHFSEAGSCRLLQLPWICHAPIQRWLQRRRHDASDARLLADPQDDTEWTGGGWRKTGWQEKKGMCDGGRSHWFFLCCWCLSVLSGRRISTLRSSHVLFYCSDADPQSHAVCWDQVSVFCLSLASGLPRFISVFHLDCLFSV